MFLTKDSTLYTEVKHSPVHFFNANVVTNVHFVFVFLHMIFSRIVISFLY